MSNKARYCRIRARPARRTLLFLSSFFFFYGDNHVAISKKLKLCTTAHTRHGSRGGAANLSSKTHHFAAGYILKAGWPHFVAY